MGDDVLSLGFAMRIYRMLDTETSDRDAHPKACGCRGCNRRRSWASEALKRATADGLQADIKAELARDL